MQTINGNIGEKRNFPGQNPVYRDEAYLVWYRWSYCFYPCNGRDGSVAIIWYVIYIFIPQMHRYK